MDAIMIRLAFWSITLHRGWTRTGPFAPGPCGLKGAICHAPAAKSCKHLEKDDILCVLIFAAYTFDIIWIHLTSFDSTFDIFWLLTSFDLWIHRPCMTWLWGALWRWSWKITRQARMKRMLVAGCGSLLEHIGTYWIILERCFDLFCVRIQIHLPLEWFHADEKSHLQLKEFLKSLSEFRRAEFSAMTLLQAMAGMKPDTLARVQVYKEPIDFKAPNPALQTCHGIHSESIQSTRSVGGDNYA